MNVIILSELMESGAGASIECCSLFGSGLRERYGGVTGSRRIISTWQHEDRVESSESSCRRPRVWQPRIESSQLSLPAVSISKATWHVAAREDRDESRESRESLRE